MDRGLVFDFHRGTTHDGPGMRTTVFLKGVHCIVNGAIILRALILRGSCSGMQKNV